MPQVSTKSSSSTPEGANLRRNAARLEPAELSTQLMVFTIKAWTRVAEHAHAQGVDTVLFPGCSKPISPREAHRLLSKLASARTLKGPTVDRFRATLESNPKDWGAQQAIDLTGEIEVVETLAWTAGLRRTMPSATGTTPMAWSFAWKLLTTPMADWMRQVRPQPPRALEDANRLSAAWRWRSHAAYYRGFTKDSRKDMRTFAKSVVDLIPTAAKLGARKKWFTPEHTDFPIGTLRCTFDTLSHFEREEADVVTRSRSWAIRTALDPSKDQYDLNACDAWQIMVGTDSAPAHPVWPF